MTGDGKLMLVCLRLKIKRYDSVSPTWWSPLLTVTKRSWSTLKAERLAFLTTLLSVKSSRDQNVETCYFRVVYKSVNKRNNFKRKKIQKFGLFINHGVGAEGAFHPQSDTISCFARAFILILYSE